MLFRKHNAEVDTPFGTGEVVSGTVYVPWVRHRGVKIGLCWSADKALDEELLIQIEERLDTVVDLKALNDGLFRSGVCAGRMGDVSILVRRSEKRTNYFSVGSMNDVGIPTVRCFSLDLSSWGSVVPL